MTSSPLCRICGCPDLELILSLGEMPLANSLLADSQLEEPEEIYPLDLAFCTQCALLQITETVPPAKLFREYLYFSSYSDTFLEHAQHLVHRLIETRSLGPSSLVVELASNDGYLLQYFVEKSVPVLGIEPAMNVAQVAEEKGINTLCEFFDEGIANKLRQEGKAADVIIANNVLAHVADLNGFVEGVRILLKDEGVAVFEVPYAKEMIDHCEFDTIYHEHLCYYSLTALESLFQKHELVLANVEPIPVHGGSLRLFVVHKGQSQPSDAVQRLLQEEASMRVDSAEYYFEFGRNVRQTTKDLRSLLENLKAEGKSIAAYGAAAKGTVLLNYCRLDGEFIDFVVDRSPHKQGWYMPGVQLPIYPPSKLLELMPDYVLVLAWNLAEEILNQQSEYKLRGGKFIIPLPELKVV